MSLIRRTALSIIASSSLILAACGSSDPVRKAAPSVAKDPCASAVKKGADEAQAPQKLEARLPPQLQEMITAPAPRLVVEEAPAPRAVTEEAPAPRVVESDSASALQAAAPFAAVPAVEVAPMPRAVATPVAKIVAPAPSTLSVAGGQGTMKECPPAK